VEGVRALLKGLEAYRQAGGRAQDAESTSRIFEQLEVLDSEGKIDIQLLRATRIGAELNGPWWRHEAPTSASQRAKSLVVRWKERCRAVQAAHAAH